MTRDYSVIQHAQSCVTELRIALNQLSQADTDKKAKEHYENIKGIIKAVQFDSKDLLEDKLHELEKMDYVPVF